MDWISRQAQISGDARQDLLRAARKHGWEMQSFGELICGEPSLHRELVDVCRPFEIAVLTRAWRMDFGAPSPCGQWWQVPQVPVPRQARRANREHLEERQHYVGGHSHMYQLDGYLAADEDGQNRETVKVMPPREAWSDNRYRQERFSPATDYGEIVGGNEATCRRFKPGAAPSVAEEGAPEAKVEAYQETPEQASKAVDAVDANAIVASSGAIFVAGRGGLKRFDLPDLKLSAAEPYAGTADPPGYADLAAGPDFIVCVDLDGCIFRYSKTCELQAKRSYQPSVVEHSQRLVASQLERLTKPIVGLEGGFGGASRLATSSRAIYLAGRDGVVTSYSAGTLSLTGRCRLQEAPAGPVIGIRALFLSAYQRLYCAVLSSVYVLAIPAMYQLARLRGGPRVPVFGSISAVVESNAGDLAFVADVAGPSIHLWSTKSWQWLSRLELLQGGGPAQHLTTANQVLYSSTETERFMAFDFSKSPPKCILEGAGGGPMATLSAEESLVIFSKGKLQLHSYL